MNIFFNWNYPNGSRYEHNRWSVDDLEIPVDEIPDRLAAELKEYLEFDTGEIRFIGEVVVDDVEGFEVEVELLDMVPGQGQELFRPLYRKG